MFNKILPMTGVEPRTSGIESNRSTNWATTTSQSLTHQFHLLKNDSSDITVVTVYFQSKVEQIDSNTVILAQLDGSSVIGNFIFYQMY